MVVTGFFQYDEDVFPVSVIYQQTRKKGKDQSDF